MSAALVPAADHSTGQFRGDTEEHKQGQGLGGRGPQGDLRGPIEDGHLQPQGRAQHPAARPHLPCNGVPKRDQYRGVMMTASNGDDNDDDFQESHKFWTAMRDGSATKDQIRKYFR